MNNKELGNGFEGELCGLLAKNRFWVHNFATKKSGQPADIIAARNKRCYLIDAKVCSKDKFDTKRIEENQKNAMVLWCHCGNGKGYFALKMSDESIYMLDHVTAIYEQRKRSILNKHDIIRLAKPFEEWLVDCR